MKTKQLKLLLGIMLYLTGFSYAAIADSKIQELQLPKSLSVEQYRKYIGEELFLPDFPLNAYYDKPFMFTIPKKELIPDCQSFLPSKSLILDGYKTLRTLNYGDFTERIQKESIINKLYKVVDVISLSDAKELHGKQINKLMTGSGSGLGKFLKSSGLVRSKDSECQVYSYFNMAAEECAQGLCFVLTDAEDELVYAFDIEKFILNSAWENLKKDFIGKSFVKAGVISGTEYGAYNAIPQSECTCTDLYFYDGSVILRLGRKGSIDGSYCDELTLSDLSTEFPLISHTPCSIYMGEELFNDFSKKLSAQNDSLRIEREKREAEQRAEQQRIQEEREKREAEQRAEQQRIQEEREKREAERKREYMLSQQAKFAGCKSIEEYLNNETDRKDRVFKKYGNEIGLQIFNNIPMKGMKKSMLLDMTMKVRSVDKNGDEEIITAEFFSCVRKIHLKNGVVTEVETTEK